MSDRRYGTVIERLREGTQAYEDFSKTISTQSDFGMPPDELPPEDEPSIWEKIFQPFSPKVRVWTQRQMPAIPSEKMTARGLPPRLPAEQRPPMTEAEQRGYVPSERVSSFAPEVGTPYTGVREPTDLSGIPEGRRYAQQFDEQGNPINPPPVEPETFSQKFTKQVEPWLGRVGQAAAQEPGIKQALEAFTTPVEIPESIRKAISKDMPAKLSLADVLGSQPVQDALNASIIASGPMGVFRNLGVGVKQAGLEAELAGRKVPGLARELATSEVGALGKGAGKIPKKAPKLPPEAVQVAKEPWMMTKDDFVTQGLKQAESEKFNVAEGIKPNIPMIRQQLENQHRTLVSDALKYDKKPVPPEVLKDYPELAKTIPKAEAGIKGTGEIVASEKTGGYHLKYRVVKDPEAPIPAEPWHLEVQYSEGATWESAMQGHYTTKDKALLAFGEKHQGFSETLKDVQTDNPLIKKGIDDFLQAKADRETARAAEELKTQAEWKRANEFAGKIKDEYKQVKFPVASTHIASIEGGKLPAKQGPSIGGLVITKDGEGKYAKYSITHRESGYSVAQDIPTQGEAKLIAWRYSQLTDWTKTAGELKPELTRIKKDLQILRKDPYVDISPAIKAKLKPSAPIAGAKPTPKLRLTPEQIYDASLADFRKASKEFTTIRTAYREKKIGDSEFLKGKTEFDKASEVADAAETAYINAKNANVKKPTTIPTSLKGQGGFVAPTPKSSVGQAVEQGLKSAKKLNQDLYVYPTAEGMKIGKEPPPFGIQHIIVRPDGSHQVVQAGESWQAGRMAGVEPLPPAKVVARQGVEAPLVKEVPPVVAEGVVPPAKPPVPLNPEDAKLTRELLSDYLAEPTTEKAWELQRDLLKSERASRFEAYRTRVPQLISEGHTLEQSLNLAKKEMAGKYPVMRTEFFDTLSQEMKTVYLNDVYNALKDEPDELLSTVEALVNALEGRPIPTKLGTGSRTFPGGGSAWLRLNRVFGQQPQLMKQLETMSKEQKPLRDIVEGIFRETPTEPIPVDQAMANYLRNLPTIGKKADLGIAEPLLQAQQKPLIVPKAGEPIVPSFLSKKEADQATLNLILELAGEPKGATQIVIPPDKYIKQFSLLPPSNRNLVLKTLKDLGWNAVDALGIPKAVKFAFDFSMMFRQLGVSGPRHPISWLKTWKPYFQAMKSDEVALKLDNMIRTEPARMNAIQKLGLDPFTVTSGASYWDRPETMASKLAERYIPGVRMSNRGAAVAVNYYMTDVGKQAIKVLDKIGAGQEEYKAMGSLINELVGRGEMPNILKGTAGDILNKLLSSPRFTASRFEWPAKLVSSSKAVRQEAWSTLLAWAGLNTSILTMAYFSGIAKVEGDPRSSGVLKIRIGNKHIDMWAGSQQIIRTAAQLAPYVDEEGTIDWSMGSRKTVSGKLIPVSRAEVLGRFAQSKESPGIGAIVSILTGRNYVGEKVDMSTLKGLGKFVVDTFAPASLQEIGDAYAIEGLPSAAVSTIGLGGIGVSTYGVPVITRWTDEGIFKPYTDIPTSSLERKEKKVAVTREQYRERHPDVDAKLFISGQVSSIQTLAALKQVKNLIEENKIDPTTITVVKKWTPEENARRLKAGLKDTLTDTLIKQLLKAQK